jgi:hypothetical protein
LYQPRVIGHPEICWVVLLPSYEALELDKERRFIAVEVSSCNISNDELPEPRIFLDLK